MIFKKMILIDECKERIATVWLDRNDQKILFIENGTNTKIIKFQIEVVAQSVYGQLEANTIHRFLQQGNKFFSSGDDYSLLNINLN